MEKGKKKLKYWSHNLLFMSFIIIYYYVFLFLHLVFIFFFPFCLFLIFNSHSKLYYYFLFCFVSCVPSIILNATTIIFFLYFLSWLFLFFFCVILPFQIFSFLLLIFFVKWLLCLLIYYPLFFCYWACALFDVYFFFAFEYSLCFVSDILFICIMILIHTYIIIPYNILYFIFIPKYHRLFIMLERNIMIILFSFKRLSYH